MNRPIRRVASLVFAMFLALMTTATYVQHIQAPKLNSGVRNARTLYRKYGTERGPVIVDGESIVVLTVVDDPCEYQREYKAGSSCTHVTDYFSTVRDSITGVERAKNGVLGGPNSALTTQRIREMISGSHHKGGAVSLTPSPAAQKVATETLENQCGAVIAINPKIGAILAQVSTPSCSPNQLATHDSEAARATYSQPSTDETRPLVNRALGGDQYTPGSTLKMLTTITMLKNLDLASDSTVGTPDTWTPPGTTRKIDSPGELSCRGGSGRVSLRQAFIQSCSTPFAMGGVSVGGERMLAQVKRFSFGMTFETPQTVSSSWFPKPSSKSALAMDGIGQQDIQITPMQMVPIGAAIANDDVVIESHVVRQTLTSDLDAISTTRPKGSGCATSKTTMEHIQEMVVADVESGTGHGAVTSGVKIAGKTGTAEINASTPPHVWFVSFAPADGPKIAVAMVVENSDNAGWNGDGGPVTAPIAERVLQAYLGSS